MHLRAPDPVPFSTAHEAVIFRARMPRGVTGNTPAFGAVRLKVRILPGQYDWAAGRTASGAKPCTTRTATAGARQHFSSFTKPHAGRVLLYDSVPGITPKQVRYSMASGKQILVERLGRQWIVYGLGYYSMHEWRSLAIMTAEQVAALAQARLIVID